MGIRNHLVEGVSATGDPRTGEATASADHQHHISDVNRVRAIVADQHEQAAFFCGGSGNFSKFLDLFDRVFVLDIDLETLHQRLDERPHDEWTSNPSERDLIDRLHRTKEDIPGGGVVVDATCPLSDVVNHILRCAGLPDTHGGGA